MLTIIVNPVRLKWVIYMELLQLKYFCDAAETENFSLTAKKFVVPPSGISQTIKRLEEELGTELFIRGANSIHLNEQGRMFYGEVKKALDSIENAKAVLCSGNESVSGEIRLSVLSNRRVITGAIECFRAKYPCVNFFINHNPQEDFKGFDLVISDEAIMDKDYEKRLLISEDILLAMCTENPLANMEKLNPYDLKEQRFITMPKGSSLFMHTNLICSMGGFMPNIAIQSDDPFYIRKYVELGLGIAFVPSFSWKGLFSDKVVLKNVGNFKRNTCVFFGRNKYKSKAVKLFLDELLKHAENNSDFEHEI